MIGIFILRRITRHMPSDFIPFSVDLLWHPFSGCVHPGEVCSGDGRPAVGHSHGASIWNTHRRRDEETQHSYSAGWRFPLPLGDRKVRALGNDWTHSFLRLFKCNKILHHFYHSDECKPKYKIKLSCNKICDYITDVFDIPEFFPKAFNNFAKFIKSMSE